MAKKKRFSRAPFDYKYNISFSQGAILIDFILGVFFVALGIGLAVWTASWVPAFFAVLGLFMSWQAIGRARQQGPQLRIGRQGIWIKKTEYIPWARALPIIKTGVSGRSVTTCFIILNRFNQGEIARLKIAELDVDQRTLQAYVDELSTKQMN